MQVISSPAEISDPLPVHRKMDFFPPAEHAGGMADSTAKDAALFATHSKITPAERARQNGHPGCVVWLTGLSAAGKSTLAVELERELFRAGRQVFVLDGDNLRHGLCSDLGFSPAAREENIRRVAEVAKLFAEAGIICITAFISPYRAGRDLARRITPPGQFLEVYLSTPLAACEQRDPKGLYARARAGKIPEFTGISAPYEPPLNPEIELRTDQLAIGDCVAQILGRINALPDPG